MEQLEEELTCPVCCCLFEDPRVLLCSHSFCRRCLEGLLEGVRGPASRAPLKCPTCRKESPHNGAGSLQINYSLRGIVDKFSRMKVMPQMSACGLHCGQPLNMFCATDRRLICGFCATTDEHRGHGFCSLEEAYKREQGALKELLREVESWRSADVTSCLETLQASKKRALQAVSADAEKVTDYFDKLIGSLECKKSEILSDFETLKLAVMQAYDPEIGRLSAALDEQSQARGIAESFAGASGPLAGHSDPLCFLRQMQEFREKIKVFKETPLPPRIDMDAGRLVRNFDVRKWDSLRLREVDRIAVPHESGSYSTGGGSRSPLLLRVICCILLQIFAVLLSALLLSAFLCTDGVTPKPEPLAHVCEYLQEIGPADGGEYYWMKVRSFLFT